MHILFLKNSHLEITSHDMKPILYAIFGYQRELDNVSVTAEDQAPHKTGSSYRDSVSHSVDRNKCFFFRIAI